MANDRMNNQFDNRPKKDWVRHNEQIRIPQVLVIHDGKNLGVMSNRDALALARNQNLDLVEVSPTARPPVCHIIDYGKYMFDRQKRQKESTAKQAQNREKEVNFRYVIGDGDLTTKAGHIRNFIAKGFKVKCVCKFKAREKAHKDQGFDLLNRVIEMLKDVSSVEIPPKHEGANIMCKLDVKKEVKESKKD
jgi:translation initiation factor IF-3